MKYRIVYNPNEKVYNIQFRFLGLFWWYLRNTNYETINSFDTEEQAKEYGERMFNTKRIKNRVIYTSE
jgi:hypothetical protein